jgi:hypothetical protein
VRPRPHFFGLIAAAVREESTRVKAMNEFIEGTYVNAAGVRNYRLDVAASGDVSGFGLQGARSGSVEQHVCHMCETAPTVA